MSEKRTPQNEAFCADKDNVVKRDECYIVCKTGQPGCFTPAEQQRHIPIGSSEPLHFLYTDADFIKDHNDVFNNRVVGYIAAVVLENNFKRVWDRTGSKAEALGSVGSVCLDEAGDDFDFPGCFDHYKSLLQGDGRGDAK